MKPLWKRVFDTVENAAAPVMADATASDGFAEIMKVGLKISRDMNSQAEALSRRLLHALNLPAAGDVAYLKNQIGSLEAEVRNLRRSLEATSTAPAAGIVSPERPARAVKQAAAKGTAAAKPRAKSAPAKRTALKTTALKTTAKKTTAKKPAKKTTAKKTAATS